MPNEKYPNTVSIPISERFSVLMGVFDSIGTGQPTRLLEGSIEPIELLDKEATLSKIVGALGSLAVQWSEYRRLPDDTGSEAVGVSNKGDVVIAVFEDKGNTTISVVDSSFLGGDDSSSDSDNSGCNNYSGYGDDDDDGCGDDGYDGDDGDDGYGDYE